MITNRSYAYFYIHVQRKKFHCLCVSRISGQHVIDKGKGTYKEGTYLLCGIRILEYLTLDKEDSTCRSTLYSILSCAWVDRG